MKINNIEGLCIKLSKVGSNKYFQLVHVKSGLGLFFPSKKYTDNKELNSILFKLSELDWCIDAEIIQNDKRYSSLIFSIQPGKAAFELQ